MLQIPKVTKNLLIINVIAFVATLLPSMGDALTNVLGLHFCLAPDFQVFQLVTYMFVHANFTHLFFNMFALWMFGCVVERVWGGNKFILFYLSCGVGAGVFQEVAQLFQFYSIVAQEGAAGISDLLVVADVYGSALNSWTTVGASGAIYAILLAFGMTFPEERIFIFPLPIPIKAKWFVIFYAVVELVSAIGTSGDGVAHVAHLGGMVVGFFMIRHWRRNATYGRRRDGGRQFFDGLRSSWERRTGKSGTSGGDASRRGGTASTGNPDWDYNARKKARQEEIDRILDKIRKSGYDSLTKEEKQKLFDSSNGG